MNFKTPFKVLTTAALIGTLSLSAVAPGVSAATNQVTAKSEAEQPTTKIDKIIISKDGKDYTIDRVLYNQLVEAEDASVKGATIKAVVSADGTYYTREAYSQALAGTDSVKEAFAALEEIAKENTEVLVETTPGSIEAGENGVEVKDPTETPEEGDFKVTEIAAITSTSAKVNFSKAVTSLAKTDVTVTDKDGKKVYVKAVTLAEDGKSANVEFYDAFTDKNTYKVAVKSGEVTAEGSFDFVKAAAKTIELATQSVGQGKAVAYKVLDANGVDITADTTVEVETDKANFFQEATKGSLKLTLGAEGSAFLKISVKDDADKTIAESTRVKITADVAAPKTLGEYWTLADDNTTLEDEDYKTTSYKAVTSLSLGATKALSLSVTDQFGEDFDTTDYTYSYKSLDTDVAVVDAESGVITPRSEGTAPIQVTLTDGTTKLTKTVEVKVLAKAKLSAIKVEKSEVTLNADNKEATELSVTGLDQFENEAALANVTDASKAVTSSNEKVVTATYVHESSNGKGTLKLTPVAAGTATVTVKNGDLSTTVKVTVNKIGDIVDYSYEGFKSELATIDDSTTTEVTENEMTVEVKGIDAKGVTAVNASKADFVVKDADGKEVGTASDVTSYKIDASDLEAGKYTLVAKVGSLTLDAKEFTVKDNSIKPTLSLKGNKFTVDGTGSTTVKAIVSELLEKDGQTINVDEVEFTSGNTSVVKADGTVDKDGAATVYLDKIKVTVSGNSNDLKNGTFTLDFKENINITVTKNTKAAKAKVDAATATITNNKYVLTGEGVTWKVKGSNTTVANDTTAPTATAEEQTITLVASATVNGSTQTKEFTVKVAADADLAKIAAAKNVIDGKTVTLAKGTEVSAANLVKPIKALDTAEEANKDAIIKALAEGKISYDSETGKATVTLESNGKSDTATVTVKVSE